MGPQAADPTPWAAGPPPEAIPPPPHPAYARLNDKASRRDAT